MEFSADELTQQPSAAALCESLRSIGYSPETAIADLIDNSIAASASRIWISSGQGLDGHSERLVIADDGYGMSRETLLQAMRPGTLGPWTPRARGDLGRFGLGLKTASFSQCRVLTVATRDASGALSVLRWDLDHVRATDRWELLPGATQEATKDIEYFFGQHAGSGTLVIWNAIDRFRAGDPEVIASIRDHVSLVFHRLLESGSIRIWTSLNPEYLGTALTVDPWDPFMREHRATTSRHMPMGSGCSATAFILPHRDRCSDRDWEAGGRGADWIQLQGCYVYRNHRLLSAGGWKAIRRSWRREPETQLARIQVDFDNRSDHEWAVDVMKSRAQPPARVRKDLRQLAEWAREQSTKAFLHRSSRPKGRRSEKPGNIVPVWLPRGSSPEDAARPVINRSHPIVRRLQETLDSKLCSLVLGAIEDGLPTLEIWHQVRVSMSNQAVAPTEYDLDALREQLIAFEEYEVVTGGRAREDVIREARLMEPFCRAPELFVNEGTDREGNQV